MNVLRVLERRHAPLWVALVFLLLGLFRLGVLPLFDPDEGFYPATARESLAEGSPLDLRLNGEPRWVKPPLAYSVQQVSMALLGESEFAVRLPSLLAGALLVWMLGRTAAAVAGARAGGLASALLAGCLGLAVLARAAHPEILLVLGWTTAWCLVLEGVLVPAERRRRRIPLWAGLALGMAFLAKGPLALLLPALGLGATALLVRGDRSWLRPAGGDLAAACGIALAVAAPWFLWMHRLHGSEFVDVVLAQLGHATSADFEHRAWTPLYFVAVLPVAFFPWSGLLPLCLRGLSRSPEEPAGRLALAAVATAGTTFLWFTLSRAQLPHYAISVLPPLALALALRMDALLARGEDHLGPLLRVCTIPAVALAVALPFLPFIAPVEVPGSSYLFESGFDVAVTAATRAALPMLLLPPLIAMTPRSRRSGRTTLGVLLAFALLLPVSAMLAASELDSRLRPPLDLWSRIIENGGGEVAVYRKRMPSLSFYTRREVAWPHDPDALHRWAATPGARWLLVHDRHLPLVLEDVPGVRSDDGEWFAAEEGLRDLLRARRIFSAEGDRRAYLRRSAERPEVRAFRPVGHGGWWNLFEAFTPADPRSPRPAGRASVPPGGGR